MATKTLHLMLASKQRTDNEAQQTEDLRYLLEQDADIIFMTETKELASRQAQIVQREKNYRLVYPGRDNEAFLVRTEPGITLLSTRHQRVTDQHPPSGGLPGYEPRAINWVKIRWHGEIIWFHGTHWPTGWFQTERRKRDHQRVSQALAERVVEHGRRSHLSFFAGDTNIDEQRDEILDKAFLPHNIFKNAGLTAAWDEFDKNPGTHGGSTIDIVGSYNKDKRVKAKRYKVHPKQNSDHRFVSVWYEISGVKRGGGDNTPDEPDRKGQRYAWSSWKDYRDNTKYELDRATEGTPDEDES